MASVSAVASPNLRARWKASAALSRACGCSFFSKLSIRAASRLIISSRVLPLAVSTIPPSVHDEEWVGCNLQAYLWVSQGEPTLRALKLIDGHTSFCPLRIGPLRNL